MFFDRDERPVLAALAARKGPPFPSGLPTIHGGDDGRVV
jgi:hypothetical protein